MTLNTVQAAAIEKMSALKAGALFMKMGTGKTRTAIKIAEGRQHDFDTLVW
ncbi:helicase SNF2, partial [Streptococcus pneumoniae]|nr:helicase SNF2 [Streptococcus pneumoniae]